MLVKSGYTIVVYICYRGWSECRTAPCNTKETNMKNIFSIQSTAMFAMILALLSILVVSCKSSPEQLSDDGIEFETDEGWVGSDVYRMWVYGEWDRNRYYIEGVEEDTDVAKGKTPRSIFGLREDSKTAAKVKAMRNFKEKMIADIQSDTLVRNSKLVSDIIESKLEGVTIAPEAVREQYSERGDANILFNFRAEDLKDYVEKAITDTVTRYREETADNEAVELDN